VLSISLPLIDGKVGPGKRDSDDSNICDIPFDY